MKCTRCGKNEVNFFYTSNINGKVTEHKLCSECANEMGLTQDVFAQSRQMMRGMFDGFFGRDMFDSFFDSFGGLGLGARDFLSLGERSECSCGDKCVNEEPKTERKTNADPELVKRRELNALRHQMKMAAKSEDFERAAELRDKIRELEG